MGYDIIVVAGQSNAEGFGFGETDIPFVEDIRIKQLYDRQAAAVVTRDGVARLDLSDEYNLLVMSERERVVRKTAFGSIGASFAREYAERGMLSEGREVLIVKCAVGGTGFARREWGIGSPLHRRMIAMIDKALSFPDSRLVAFLWHQGEHEVVEMPSLSAAEKHKKHKMDLGETFSDIRRRYGNDFPILAAGFCDEWYFENREISDAVISAIAEVLSEDVRGGFVLSSGLLSNSQQNGGEDKIHFSRNSLYLLGKRYFDAYLKLI